MGETPDIPRYAVSSIAATGFGVAVIAHAGKTGLLPREQAQARVLTTLEFVRDRMSHHFGWLYHFTDWAEGIPLRWSEVSTIDTALFLAGALYAGEVFKGTKVEAAANDLYRRVDFWQMMQEGDPQSQKRTLSMGWKDGKYLKWQWDSYAEHMILILLGLGHPVRPLPRDTWTAWKRPQLEVAPQTYLFGADQSLFVHQYSHLFVDFRNYKDQYGNYFVNSVIATEREIALCEGDENFKTYEAGFWGRSASDSPTGYFPFSPNVHNGTVCPGCAAASVMFTPSAVLASLDLWAKNPFVDKFYGQYGFVDAINLQKKGDEYFSTDTLGITAGPLYLAIANVDSPSSVWETFHNLESIRLALGVAFDPKRVELEDIAGEFLKTVFFPPPVFAHPLR